MLLLQVSGSVLVSAALDRHGVFGCVADFLCCRVTLRVWCVCVCVCVFWGGMDTYTFSRDTWWGTRTLWATYHRPDFHLGCGVECFVLVCIFRAGRASAKSKPTLIPFSINQTPFWDGVAGVESPLPPGHHRDGQIAL